MITNKLQPNSSKSSILLELSDGPNPPECLNLFFKEIKQEQIPYKKSILPEYQLNIYYVLQHKTTTYKNIALENIPSQFEHAMTILYLTPDNYDKLKLAQKVHEGRTLIIREDLQNDFFSLDFQVESVESKMDGLAFLCSLIASFINRMASGGVQFYDKNAEGIYKIKKDSQNILKQTWTNIIYQIPGIGKEKCLRIVEEFPTYQSILNDYANEQRLKDIEVVKGVKKNARLGPELATRIYKVLLSTKHMESVI